MLVRQLIGGLAGQIVDMPYHVAQSCIANGTAALPDAEVRVRGLDVAGPPSPRVDVPEDWKSLHHLARMSLARKVNPALPARISTKQADEAIEAYLAGNA
jgi:hypothetical protein